MSNLLEKYEMLKEAEAKEAEASIEKTASAEELELIEKYASAADDLLAKEYGKEYSEEDVEKLATKMIQEDLKEASEEEEEFQKVASLVEAGQVIAKSFLETIKAQA